MTAAALATHEPRSRPPFRERVLALAGHGAFREPTPPGTQQRTVPADHMIAAALAYGRRGPEDVGPDVAVAMATGRIGEASAVRVMQWVGSRLRKDRRVAFKRASPWLAHYSAWALNAVIEGAQHDDPSESKVFRWLSYFPPAPEGVTGEEHILIAVTACDDLDRAADDALALAARRWRG